MNSMWRQSFLLIWCFASQYLKLLYVQSLISEKPRMEYIVEILLCCLHKFVSYTDSGYLVFFSFFIYLFLKLSSRFSSFVRSHLFVCLFIYFGTSLVCIFCRMINQFSYFCFIIFLKLILMLIFRSHISRIFWWINMKISGCSMIAN